MDTFKTILYAYFYNILHKRNIELLFNLIQIIFKY